MITILIAHVILLSLSLIITMGSAIFATLGYRIPTNIIAANVTGTTVGVACGIVLLFSMPIDMRCIVLFVYVAAFAAVHIFVSRKNQALSTSVGE